MLSIKKTSFYRRLWHIVDAVNAAFLSKNLQDPTRDGFKQIFSSNERKDFKRMLVNIDRCKLMCWNCPTVWHRQYKGKIKGAAVTVEESADQRLVKQHAYFVLPGCLNDITVVQASSLPARIAAKRYPLPFQHVIVNVRRNKPYWQGGHIYPKWPIFQKMCSELCSSKEKLLENLQEAVRKDVEHVFGALQIKWHKKTLLARLQSVDTMARVVRYVIILHNMMVEERGDYQRNWVKRKWHSTHGAT